MASYTELAAGERIEEEMPLGIYPISEEQTTAAMGLPSIDRLLQGTRLTVPSHGGAQLRDAALVRRLHAEWRRDFGGWLEADLTPFLTLHDSLVSAELRTSFRDAGMTVSWDEPETAFYHLAFKRRGWWVQGAGELGSFHCLFVAKSLANDQAVGEGGHPRARPLGAVSPVIADVAPTFGRSKLRDLSSRHPPNVFDIYLQGKRRQIKAGVRMRLVDGRQPASPYFYGIRLNLELRRR